MNMDFEMGNGGNSADDEQEESNSQPAKKNYHRHTAHQIQQLESFFKDCPHPDESQRRQLSRELRLEAKQIKFWFQNKRTQTKAQNERADNSALRAENGKIQCENQAIKEALKNVICPACGGPPFGEEERQRCLHKLRLENTRLKEEHEKVSCLLAKYIGKPISQMDSLLQHSSPSLDLVPTNMPPFHGGISSNQQFKGITNMERALILETVACAMQELIKLLRINEPLWIKTPSSNGRYMIHRDTYDKIFPRTNHFKNSSARIESSKYSGLVNMSGFQLVDLFLDAEQWTNLFPTIVTRARTIQVVDNGMRGNRNGALQLMHEQMHILSPLVPSREFYFLRRCQQLEQGMWVIVDTSYDYSNEDQSPLGSWRLPSGCMIKDMPNGCAEITWVEHVEVDDKSQTHRLYRDLICGCAAYGAERWIVTLQRMCERLTFSLAEVTPSLELAGGGGVLRMGDCKKNMAKLANRMVKDFHETLCMSRKLDFPQLSELHNSGVRVSTRSNTTLGSPTGTIMTATTSLWLPLPFQDVFNFFRDGTMRFQWDVLSNGNPVHEVAHIAVGAHPGNRISVIRPSMPTGNMVMLQESSIDPLGSMVVYAPIDIPALNGALTGENLSNIPLLPSGFVISHDGRPSTRSKASTSASSNRSSSGSLLTIAFQILVSSPSSSAELNMESVATVNTLISSTVQRIKLALDCSNMD